MHIHAHLRTMEKSNKNNVPVFSPNLFWDINADDLNMEQHKTFIVNRVLDYGQWDDWKTILDYYGLEQITSIAKGLRSLFPKSLAFISTVSRIPENQFRCYEHLQSKNKLWHF